MGARLSASTHISTRFSQSFQTNRLESNQYVTPPNPKILETSR